MSDIHSVTIIAVAAAVTMILRFLPFVVFGRGKKTPSYIYYLSFLGTPLCDHGNAGGILSERCQYH